MECVQGKKSQAYAWLDAAERLLKARDRIYNLVVEIDTPSSYDEASIAIEKKVDEFLRQHNCQPLHTVSDTIFPAAEYKAGGLEQVLKYPQDVYPHIKSLNANRWGTYALRLTQRTCSDGTTIQPLDLVINKLRSQLGNKSPQRALYELDLALEPMELKFYEAEKDHKNPRGGQCLNHVSLKIGAEGQLYLTALYRYQFFMQKALGNYRGLARLQACIADAVGLTVGPLVCHSTLALFEEGDGKYGQVKWSRQDLQQLVDECKRLVEHQSAVSSVAAKQAA